MYLTQDYKGISSKKQYGKKGDKVKVLIKRENMVLVELNNEKFWVNENLLSEKK